MLPLSGGQDKEGEAGRAHASEEIKAQGGLQSQTTSCLLTAFICFLLASSSENCDHIDDIGGQASYCVVIHVLFKGQGFVKVIRDSVGLK